MNNFKQYLNEIKQISELSYGDSEFDANIDFKYMPHAEKKIEKARQIIKAEDMDANHYIGFHGSLAKFTQFDPKANTEFGFHFATSYEGTDWFTDNYYTNQGVAYLYVVQIPKKFKFLKTPDLGWHNWENLFDHIAWQDLNINVPTDLLLACQKYKNLQNKLYKGVGLNNWEKAKNDVKKQLEKCKQLFLKYYDGIIYKNEIETPYGLWVRSPCHERLNEINILRRITIKHNDKNWDIYDIKEVKKKAKNK